MVHIEIFKQLWKTCLRRSWLEEVLHKPRGATKKNVKGSPKSFCVKKKLLRVPVMSANNHQSQNKQVDRSQNSSQELSFEEKLPASLINWVETSSTLIFNNSSQQFYQHIYQSLGNIALKPEMVESILISLQKSEKTNSVILFRKLEDFYRRWCNGEFIDAAPENNLPQKQMLQLQAQNVAIGLRQVDINTGLNVMILLLELHRFLHSQNQNLETEITFYPSEKPDGSNFFTSRLLRIINYSDSIEIGNFSNVVGAFLKSAQLEGAYLGDANLTGANLSNANLSAAYLGDANLTGIQANKVNLVRANLGDANLSGADLTEANLTHCDLSHCNLSGGDLSGANLTSADLGDANLAGANLAGANLAGANLTSANLRDAILDGANLKGAILFGANLSDTNLIGAEISYADLCRTDLSGSNLQGSTLKGTNLSDSILFSTNLTKAILLGTDISYAKLNGAKLRHANLVRASIFGADLSDVDLTEVILKGANLTGAKLKSADLNSADLREAILIGTDLSYANLNNANLDHSNLKAAILTGASLNHTNLSGAELCEANLENITWNEDKTWEKACGLDKAVNLPQTLKEKLRLA